MSARLNEEPVTCQHCDRHIVNEGGVWVDPAATGDDSMWRETCESHDTFEAVHEPKTRLNYEQEARYADLPEGSLAVCRYCNQPILLDQREGGGPAKDWGCRPVDWTGNGGIGMDYGCGEHPATDDDGTWGHVPDFSTIRAKWTW